MVVDVLRVVVGMGASAGVGGDMFVIVDVDWCMVGNGGCCAVGDPACAVVVVADTVTLATDGNGVDSVRGELAALAGCGDRDLARRTQAAREEDGGEVGASSGGRTVLVDCARFLPLRMSMAGTTAATKTAATTTMANATTASAMARPLCCWRVRCAFYIRSSIEAPRSALHRSA